MDEIRTIDIPESEFRTQTDILGRPQTQFAEVEGETVMRPAPKENNEGK